MLLFSSSYFAAVAILHTVSSFIPHFQRSTISFSFPLFNLSFIFCLCLFVTCCQLFNISKHMMSNKNFPVPHKYTFNHHFYAHEYMSTQLSHPQHMNNKMIHLHSNTEYILHITPSNSPFVIVRFPSKSL